MAATYCTVAQVASRLGVSTFDGSSDPTSTEVTEFIEDAQDEIDHHTGHAWRTVTVTEEYHSLDAFAYNIRDGISIKLHHRKITTFASGTDKLEVWDGSQWVDYVADKTEGRNNDYWVDYTNGRVFIKTIPYLLPRFYEVRVTYRYGESSVPSDIRKATALLAARDVIMQDDKSLLLPEGSDNVPYQEKARMFEEQAYKLINKRKEYQVVTN